jgi:hypothetical protein
MRIVSTTIVINQGKNSGISQISYASFELFTKLKFTKCSEIIHCLCSVFG